MEHKIVPNLWFDTEAEEAADCYCSIFPNSRIVSVARYPESGPREAGHEEARHRGAAGSGGRRYDCFGMIEIFPEVSSTAHATLDSDVT